MRPPLFGAAWRIDDARRSDKHLTWHRDATRILGMFADSPDALFRVQKFAEFGRDRLDIARRRPPASAQSTANFFFEKKNTMLAVQLFSEPRLA